MNVEVNGAIKHPDGNMGMMCKALWDENKEAFLRIECDLDMCEADKCDSYKLSINNPSGKEIDKFMFASGLQKK